MARQVAGTGLLLVGLTLSVATVGAAPSKCYDWILKEKLRGGYLSAHSPRSAAARMAAIGMNAVLPKFGGLTYPASEANLTLLREWSEATRAAGIHLLPVLNFRGGETEKILGARREVTAAGQTMERTPCPLDEQFWNTYVLGRAVCLARLGEVLHIDGVVIDPEMYGADHTTYRGVCYCSTCLREFLLAASMPVPEVWPAPAARAEWLASSKLADRFRQHFIDRIKGFCVRVERAVHELNPDFLLGVLLLDYPHPFMRGMAEGLGTARHPVLGFSETTYSSGYTKYVGAQQKTFASFPSHVLFFPGLWIRQFPTENIAEQCYACARESRGYWIYTFESLEEDVRNFPGYVLREPHERYWDAMRIANVELGRWIASGGQYESPLRVRSFVPPLPVLVVGDLRGETLVPVRDDSPVSLGPEVPPRLRYRNPLFVLA